ncbi:MAG: tRNA uridine-5-carboxymethylaminomethyl(34) synthesis GTPase MnmE [Clostridia bacterium]|nr:tRNA uridine-5-carboxymethylaminomethyl(34) synthesis GTPase MnmE [Clostridia bacterium]
MESTIAAISTAYGESGIGIVRMSGPMSLNILTKIFVSAKGVQIIKPRYMHYGYIEDPQNGTRLDEVLAVYMKAPHTYTGEDVVEIQCHGSYISLKEILALCLRSGAEPAGRGEFTKRAFLNGRMDLSQAEAVIDLIKARSSRSFDAALGQMGGNLSSKVRAVRDKLKELLIDITVNMDYPDEDIEEITYDQILNRLSLINDEINNLLVSAGEGKIIREGLSVAIVGKPNVGKSSLMNVFLKENRSIVTDIPGTTRDTIEEQASLRGIRICFTDTAGIHETDDPVESLGIERSKQAFDKADLILLLIDSSTPLEEEDKELLKMINDRSAIIVLNKQDLHTVTDENMLETAPNLKVIKTSLAEGKGVEELEDAIEMFVTGGQIRRENDVLVTNVRHASLLRKAKEEVEQAENMTAIHEALDFIEVNIRAAFDYLGEITGDTASDEIINEIFARFCLGK